MLLSDSEVEQAWQLAVQHGCPQPLWMALAGAREDEHPLDAVMVYKREIDDLIDRKQAHSYEQADAHVVHVRDLYARAGAEEDFAAYTHDLRHRHKPKMKFLAMLAAAMPPT
ncbi:MAG: hypothetical protein M3P48_09705 [Actinomycetota bacterium]|nr:hypothetical protein [Actinomycetota bacterium]